jgi:hypothetical protein
MENDRLLDSLKPAEVKAAVLAEMNERLSSWERLLNKAGW